MSISATCYVYQAKLSNENAEIADWLLRLTTTHKRWGFGLCFLFLRNTKGFKRNHKRVYRIYRELELNLRIKPRNRIKRDKPEALSVPSVINQVWPVDFMSDSLKDGRSLALLMCLMTLIANAWPLMWIFHCPQSESFVLWNKSLSGEANLVRCDNGPEYISQELIGRLASKLRCYIFSLVNRLGMLMLNDLTEQQGVNGWS